MSGRLKEVDGLRAVAVGAVIAFHFLPAYFPGGALGVDIFFVISGLVITRSLLADRQGLGRISLPRFYWKRVWRIMPALWATVAATLVAGLILGRPQGREAVATLLSVMNWARAFNWVGPDGLALGHAWSLSIEEQFYLLWPLGLILLLKLPRRIGLAALLLFVLVLTGWRAALAALGGDFLRIYNGLDTHTDGLMVGCLIALWGRAPPRWVSATWAVPVAALALATLRYGPAEPIDVSVALSSRALFSAWLLWAAAGPETRLHPLLRSSLFQWGGSRSYSLYLWHYPVSFFLHPYDFFFPAKLALMAALTVGAAELSYRLVEQPFQRFGRARLARRTGGGAEGETETKPESAGLAEALGPRA